MHRACVTTELTARFPPSASDFGFVDRMNVSNTWDLGEARNLAPLCLPRFLQCCLDERFQYMQPLCNKALAALCIQVNSCKAATSSCARGRTRECGRLAVGNDVVTRSAHVYDHTDVTQTPNLTFQTWGPPEVPHLCHAAATSSCARGRARECGCLAFGAALVTRSAHVRDHAGVTQTLSLAFQIWEPPQVPHLCRAAATSSTNVLTCSAAGAVSQQWAWQIITFGRARYFC